MEALAPPAAVVRTIGVKRSHQGKNLKSVHTVSKGTLTADGDRVWPEEYRIGSTYSLPHGLPPGLILDASTLHLAGSAEKLKSVDKRRYKCVRAWLLRQADGSYRRTQKKAEAASFLAAHGFSFVDLRVGAAAPALPVDVIVEVADVCTSAPAVGRSTRLRSVPS